MESGLHGNAGFGRLHSAKQRIKFRAERIELKLGGVRERVELVHRHQDSLGSIVPGNHDHFTLNDILQDSAKLILGFSCGK